MEEANNTQDIEKAQPEIVSTETVKKEIERLKRLREDVLLLRFHLARRTDITQLIDDTDRLTSESALKSSLEILEKIDRRQSPPTGHIAAAASSLMYALDILVNAARMAAEKDATDEPPLPVTPESLRASLPMADITAALGAELRGSGKRQTAGRASNFIHKNIWMTTLFFLLALAYHLFLASSVSETSVDNLLVVVMGKSLIEMMGIVLSGFLWATVGAYVWILMRFRKFGAAYAFDPAHAEVFSARVYSGAIISAVILYFVFGGEKPWAGNWQVNLPLWGFVLGYAGRLQVECLRIMVERVQSAITKLSPPSIKEEKGKKPPDKNDVTYDEPPTLKTLEKPAAKEHGKAKHETDQNHTETTP